VGADERDVLQEHDDTLHDDLDTTPEPAASERSVRRGRPRAVPLLVHGTNGAAALTGAAYVGAGAAGLMAVGAAGAAAGAAALYRSRRTTRTRPATGTRNGGSGGSGRGGSGAGGGYRSGAGGGGWRTGSRSGGLIGPRNGSGSGSRSGLGSGGLGSGRSGSRNGPGGGSGTGRSGGGTGRSGSWFGSGGSGRSGGGLGTAGTRGPGTAPRSGREDKPGRLRGAARWLNGRRDRQERRDRNTDPTTDKHRRRNPDRSTDPRKKTRKEKDKKPGAVDRSRSGRLRRWVRAAAGRLSPTRTRGADTTAAGTTKPGSPVGGRWYRLRRIAARKTAHWARCGAAGLVAAFAGLLTLPASVLWGLWRTITRHRDPLHAWLLPIRIAGRVWRRLRRRSRRRHDREQRADALTLTVHRGKDDTTMSGSLTPVEITFDPTHSRFGQAMNAAHAAYTGYRPRSMMEVAAEYAGLPNSFHSTADAIRHLTLNCAGKYPCSPRAAGKLGEAYERLLIGAARARDMVSLFRDLHAFDIERIRNPRTNEWMWNVTPLAAESPEGAMFAPGRLESGCVMVGVLYRTYEPEHMMDVGNEMAGIGLGLAHLGEALGELHHRTRTAYPVDERVTDELGTLASIARAAADDAALAAKLYAADHAREIHHNLHPRKGMAGEAMWNAPR
ncbi:hypothetical protein, partial [Streptomyces alkaliphilus]|uniref:hypothetical protein n=1 Tax=Streptomyces alkaliphilus TaxID=1472722 RepID=UPI0015F9D5C0